MTFRPPLQLHIGTTAYWPSLHIIEAYPIRKHDGVALSLRGTTKWAWANISPDEARTLAWQLMDAADIIERADAMASQKV